MAGVKFTGDFAKLRKLIARLDAVGRGKAIPKVLEAMGDEAMRLVSLGFRQDTDPYGQPWAPHSPRTKQKANSRLLRYSRKMYRGFKLSFGRSSFSITNSEPYAGVHQNGADYIARPRVSFRNASGGFGRITKKRGVKGLRMVPQGAHRIVIPARKMFPTHKMGLGRWESHLQRAGKRVVYQMIRGK